MSDPTGPIFIGGLSHSGKTEMRRILGSHPDICMTRRTYLWDRYFGRFGDLTDDGALDRCLATIVAEGCLQDLGIDLARVRAELRDGVVSYARLFGLIHQHHAQRLGKRRWGDQLAHVERFADPIFESFGWARMIHMIRDPRNRFAETSLRARRRRGALGLETAEWLHSADLAERNQKRYGGRYLVVRFEQLAADPEGTTHEVCAFIGEELTSTMRDEALDLVFDRSSLEGVVKARAAPAAGSAFVTRYARRGLVSFDYALCSSRMTFRDRVTYAFIDWPLNRATLAAWTLVGGTGSTQRKIGG